jgi:thymidine kinase
MKGKLEVITGCMFSGKSEELIRRLKRSLIAKQKIKIFKPVIDTRYSKVEIVSHGGVKMEAQPISSAQEILNYIHKNTQVVAIDEAQFFDLELVNIVKFLVKNGKRVIIAGLDTDFRGEPFGLMPYLMTLADEVIKLHAICNVCGGEATMTQRLINGEPANYNDPVILIGGKETYEARCRKHHIVPGTPNLLGFSRKLFPDKSSAYKQSSNITETIIDNFAEDAYEVTRAILENANIPIDRKVEQEIKEKWREYFYAENILLSKKLNKKGGKK